MAFLRFSVSVKLRDSALRSGLNLTADQVPEIGLRSCPSGYHLPYSAVALQSCWAHYRAASWKRTKPTVEGAVSRSVAHKICRVGLWVRVAAVIADVSSSEMFDD